MTSGWRTWDKGHEQYRKGLGLHKIPQVDHRSFGGSVSAVGRSLGTILEKHGDGALIRLDMVLSIQSETGSVSITKLTRYLFMSSSCLYPSGRSIDGPRNARFMVSRVRVFIYFFDRRPNHLNRRVSTFDTLSCTPRKLLYYPSIVRHFGECLQRPMFVAP